MKSIYNNYIFFFQISLSITLLKIFKLYKKMNVLYVIVHGWKSIETSDHEMWLFVSPKQGPCKLESLHASYGLW